MIVMKNIKQPYGPTYTGYRGVVTRQIPSGGLTGYRGVVMRNPMNGYGRGYRGFGSIVVDSPVKIPWAGYRGYRGFGDDDSSMDYTKILSTGISNTGNILTGITGVINTLTGANKTGTVTASGTSQSIPGTTGYSTPPPSTVSSVASSIPSYVWIAGGVLLVGGAALLLMK